MDAVKFLEERKRKFNRGEPVPALSADIDCNYEDAVKEIEEWSAAHPLKTRQSVFMEQWPDVYLDGNRVISVSPCTVSKEYRDMDCDLRDCAECRKEFWMKEVE